MFLVFHCEGNESEELEISAAVSSSGEGRESDDHLVVPMAAEEPNRHFDAVRDAVEQSNEDGARVRGESHELRGIEPEGGGGAPAAAFEVAEIVSNIHQNQMRRALGTGSADSAPELLQSFREAEEGEEVEVSESSGTHPMEGSTAGEAGDGREPGGNGAHETSEHPAVGVEASRRFPEASWREGDHAEERDGREGQDEPLANVPSEVAYVSESLEEIDGEAVEAAAVDIAEINYEVRRNFRVVSANNDFVLLKKGPVPARPVFVAVGSPANSHGLQGLEAMQNLPRILAIRDQYEATLKSCGYAVTFDRDQRGTCFRR